MKINIILSLLVLLAGYATCKNLRKTPVQTPPAAETPGPESGYPVPAASVHGERADTAAGTLQVKQPPRRVEVPWDKVTPATTSRRAYMASGWWSPKMAYQPSDTTVHVNYQDKWLKFREDQTFDMYVNGKIVDSGHWAYDDPNKVMYIACQNVYFNNTWVVQERGFRMVWKGNTDLNVTGIQIRMDNYPKPPWE